MIEIHTILDEDLNIGNYNYVMPRSERIKKIEKVYSENSLHIKRNNWKQVIQRFANQYKHIYKVYFWSNKQSNSTFHDRYIFTDIIAVSPKHSISGNENSDQDTLWQVLNKTEREKQEPKYDFDDPYFIPSCEPIEVEPNE